MKKVNDLEQRTPEWHAWRAEGWTATEASALMGMNSFTSLHDLWELKLGFKAEPDLSRVPAVQYGVAHEDDCRSCWEQCHGESAEPVCGESDEHPLFRASFDGLTSSGIPVECKCIPKKEAFDEVVAEGSNSSRFKRYWPQVQQQMLVSQADHAWLCFWHEGEYAEFRIERDEAFAKALVEKGEKFWADHIVTRLEPEPEPDTWAPEGEDAQKWALLAQRHLADMAMREKLAAAMKVLEDRMANRMNQLAEIMGENKIAEADGLKITRIDRAGSYDYKSYCLKAGISEEELKPFFREGSSYYKATAGK